VVGRENQGRAGLLRSAQRRRIGRRGGGRAPVLAVLDLGSNNCRLLVARPADDGGFRVVDSFSRIVRLGEGVAQTHRLSEAAIERTLAALQVCGEHIRASHATHVYAIATAAARDATNAQELVDRARTETGIALNIVTPEEEARLAATGCAPLIGAEFEGALVFDIGGGSSEIIWMRRDGGAEPRIVHFASVPVGVVSLAEDVAHAAMDRASFDAMRASMIERFAKAREAMDAIAPFRPETHHLLGTSGTVTTLAAVAMNLERYMRAKVDASWHASADILHVVDRLIGLDHAGRAAIGPVGQDRADLVIPGCAIFAAMHTLWPCTRLRVADRGLREGMLRELMLKARA
jgi:exopolyphosphatase/guanosine-5'-triphosphate,3'-diphosphate pyrophosphatase